MATRGEIYEKCGVVSLMTEDEANEELSEEDGVLLENILKHAWTFFTRQGSVPWSFKHHSFCKSLFFPEQFTRETILLYPNIWNG